MQDIIVDCSAIPEYKHRGTKNFAPCLLVDSMLVSKVLALITKTREKNRMFTIFIRQIFSCRIIRNLQYLTHF